MMEQLIDAQVESRHAEELKRINRELQRRLDAALEDAKSLREANHQLGLDVQGSRNQLMKLYDVVGELTDEKDFDHGPEGIASVRAELAIQRQELLRAQEIADLSEATLEGAREETRMESISASQSQGQIAELEMGMKQLRRRYQTAIDESEVGRQSQLALAQVNEHKAAQRYSTSVKIGNEHRLALEASRASEMSLHARVVELERELMAAEGSLLKQGVLEEQVHKLQDMLIHASSADGTPRVMSAPRR